MNPFDDELMMMVPSNPVLNDSNNDAMLVSFESFPATEFLATLPDAEVGEGSG